MATRIIRLFFMIGFMCGAPLAAEGNVCTDWFQDCVCPNGKPGQKGICMEGPKQPGLYCHCSNLVMTDKEILAWQQKKFEDTPALFFAEDPSQLPIIYEDVKRLNAMNIFSVGFDPLNPEKAKMRLGQQIKDLLREKLKKGQINYYSLQIPEKARIKVTGACAGVGASSVIRRLLRMLKAGGLGRTYFDGTSIPDDIIKKFNEAILRLNEEIMNETIGVAACDIPLRFSSLVRERGITLTPEEVEVVFDLCNHVSDLESARNNDLCVCPDRSIGLCQVDLVDEGSQEEPVLSPHCQ